MCKWICFCCYPKDKTIKKKSKSKSKKPKNIKTDKQVISKKCEEQTETPDGQPIESYYGEKPEDNKPKTEMGKDITVSDVTHIYELPNENCNSVRDLMKYLGYDMRTALGKGAFGQVLECIHTDKKTGEEKVLACKEINLSQEDKRDRRLEAIKREITGLKLCKHRYIIGLEDHFVVKCGDEWWAFLFMEFADCGTLQHQIDEKRLTNEEAKRYFQQIATALFYTHRQKIAHKDLKLENVLITTNKSTGLKEVRVADFGLSENVFKPKKAKIRMGHFGGTPGYMAPEILKIEIHKKHRKVLDLEFDPFKSDVWALGICLFKMLTNTLPFESYDLNTMVEKQESRSFSFPTSVRDSIDPKAVDLIRKLLEPDVTKRIDPLGVLLHPWIEDIVDLSLIETKP